MKQAQSPSKLVVKLALALAARTLREKQNKQRGEEAEAKREGSEVGKGRTGQRVMDLVKKSGE